MSMIEDIIKISKYFLDSAEDPEELQKLISVANDRRRWAKSHSYFDEIRHKNLKTKRKNSENLNTCIALLKFATSPYSILRTQQHHLIKNHHTL